MSLEGYLCYRNILGKFVYMSVYMSYWFQVEFDVQCVTLFDILVFHGHIHGDILVRTWKRALIVL